MIRQICLLPHGDEVLKPDDQDVKEIRKIMIECGNRVSWRNIDRCVPSLHKGARSNFFVIC